MHTAMYAAMKAKDKERKDALSMLLGALKAKAIEFIERRFNRGRGEQYHCKRNQTVQRYD